MITRRSLLQSLSAGFGYMAFSALAAAQQPQESASVESAEDNPLAPKAPHFNAKAKRVIFLCMSGGPSHVDTFDYKAALSRDDGKQGRYGGRLLKSPWEFRQRGESGLWISDLFPNVAEHADEMTLIRSMQCDQPVHPGAMTQMHTGTAQFIRPSLGAWTLYALGSENDSLPGFVSLSPPSGNAGIHGSAFLPSIYSGTKIGRGGRAARFAQFAGAESLPDISSRTMSRAQQRRQIDFIQELNRKKLARAGEGAAEIEGVIESYELAFRMQDAMPDVMDIADETPETLALYGADGGATEAFGKQCLLARRMAESGVRFIEITHGGWDQHANLRSDHATQAEACDKPIAGLLTDLRQRGLLDETLVIWGGEFGRTPAAQGNDGRNHNNKGYTTWMAGGGVKGGFSYGSTDEHGYEAVENPCHIHDWHATILHLLGLDHERLTYRYAGRDFRLTDVHGTVATDIIA